MMGLTRRLAEIEGRKREDAERWKELNQEQRDQKCRVRQVNDEYDHLAVECAKKSDIVEGGEKCAADLRRLTLTVTKLHAKLESLNQELEKKNTRPSSGAGLSCAGGAQHPHPQPSSRTMAFGPSAPQPATQNQSSSPTRAGVGHGSVFAATSVIQ